MADAKELSMVVAKGHLTPWGLLLYYVNNNTVNLMCIGCVVHSTTRPRMPPLLCSASPAGMMQPIQTHTHIHTAHNTGVQPRQIGCVITNSSLFNPTPSLSAMIMNHFKMGTRTINYNLGGMGCSASLLSIDLAKQVGALNACLLACLVG